MFSVWVCFGSKCFTFFLLRDVFESLKFCWDLWLSSLLVCIHLFVFFLYLKKLFFIKLDRFSTGSYLSSPLDFFSRQILLHFRSIKLSGLCLNRFLIHQETFCLADRFSTESWSIEVLLPSTNSYLSRFSARQISIAPQSIKLRYSIYT